MTEAEMADAIVALVRERGSVSFIEMQQRIGDESRGDFSLESPRNVVWWTGMSEKFLDALELAKDRIEPYPAHLLVYMVDGAYLKLPIMKRCPPKNGFKTPHWLPLVFNERSAKPPARRQAASGTRRASRA